MVVMLSLTWKASLHGDSEIMVNAEPPWAPLADKARLPTHRDIRLAFTVSADG
jgi:hypothetical protein